MIFTGTRWTRSPGAPTCMGTKKSKNMGYPGTWLPLLGINTCLPVGQSKPELTPGYISSSTDKRTEERAPVWGSEFTSKKTLHYKGGVMVVLRPLFAAALVVCRRYFIVAPSPRRRLLCIAGE